MCTRNLIWHFFYFIVPSHAKWLIVIYEHLYDFSLSLTLKWIKTRRLTTTHEYKNIVFSKCYLHAIIVGWVFAFRETIYICSLLSIVVVITCFCFSHVCAYMICVHEFPLNMSDEMRLQSEKKNEFLFHWRINEPSSDASVCV